jgi:hypothetical protein
MFPASAFIFPASLILTSAWKQHPLASCPFFRVLLTDGARDDDLGRGSLANLVRSSSLALSVTISVRQKDKGGSRKRRKHEGEDKSTSCAASQDEQDEHRRLVEQGLLDMDDSAGGGPAASLLQSRPCPGGTPSKKLKIAEHHECHGES